MTLVVYHNLVEGTISEIVSSFDHFLEKPMGFHVNNQFLTESFDSQTNIVFIIANGMRKSLNLDRKISEGEISFN